MIDYPAICELKVASRCNINCRYCYVYNLGDDSYTDQPKFLTAEIARATAGCIRRYVERHQLRGFHVLLHGGEPLLAPLPLLWQICDVLAGTLATSTQLSFSIQTNGTAFIPEHFQLFNHYGIEVSVSLDGSQQTNDSLRVDHQGRGTYSQVAAGLKLAQRSLPQVLGPHVLMVVNPDSDPIGEYWHIRELGVGTVDLLLPLANYQLRAPAYSRSAPLASPAYGKWLSILYRLWRQNGRFPFIRLLEAFDSSVAALYSPLTTIKGSLTHSYFVVNTDGTLEVADNLKACGNRFTASGLSVFSDSIDDLLSLPLAVEYYSRDSLVPLDCVECPMVRCCRGGFIGDRYSKTRGFANRSVYCDDLFHMYRTISEFNAGREGRMC